MIDEQERQRPSEGGVATRRAGARGALAFVMASTLLSALSFSIVIPVLPELVRQLAGGDHADAAEWMMLLAAAWGLTQCLFSPLLGALSDRHGRRPVLLCSVLGLGIDFLFMAFAPTLALFLVGRLISGATSATFPTARAYIADVTSPAHRTAAFGRLAATLSVGFIAGPALGGLVSGYDLRLPFVIAAVLCLANFLLGLAVLRESLPAERRSAGVRWNPFSVAIGGSRLLGVPGIRAMLGVSFLVSLANMLWSSVWVLFCGYRFGWSPFAMGLQIMAAGVLGVLVQAWLVKPVVARFGERRTLSFGLLVSAASQAYAAFAPDGWWFVASMPVAALGLMLAPSLSGLLSEKAGADNQGRVHGYAQALHGLASVIGPPLYGLVFAWSLRSGGPVDLSGAAVLLSAGLFANGWLLAAAIRERS